MARVFAHFIILISFLFLSLGYSMQYNFSHLYKTMAEKNSKEWKSEHKDNTDFLKSSSLFRMFNISFNVTTSIQLKAAYNFYNEYPFIIINDDDHELSKDLSDSLGAPFSQPEMILDLTTYKPSYENQNKLDIKKVESADDLKLFAQTLAIFYKLDSDSQKALLLPGSLEFLNTYTSFMALLKGVPVAVISYYIDDHGVVSVSNLAVDENQRRKGIGSMLAHHAINDAHHNHATIAALIASPDGEKLYKTIGFKTTKIWHMFFPKNDEK
jgi:GNAT superfamily N-acetyltransferase